MQYTRQATTCRHPGHLSESGGGATEDPDNLIVTTETNGEADATRSEARACSTLRKDGEAEDAGGERVSQSAGGVAGIAADTGGAVTRYRDGSGRFAARFSVQDVRGVSVVASVSCATEGSLQGRGHAAPTPPAALVAVAAGGRMRQGKGASAPVGAQR